MRSASIGNRRFETRLLYAALTLFTLALIACAGTHKASLRERLTAMTDADLVAFYQGIDARLRVVGEGVRQESAEDDKPESAFFHQQTYFLGGEGQRLLQERTAAEKELLRRRIPRSEWASRP
jgi:Tfp pilus assembly protein PilX